MRNFQVILLPAAFFAALCVTDTSPLWAETGCGEPAPSQCCRTCKSCPSHHCRRCCKAEAPPQAVLVQSIPVALFPNALLTPASNTTQNDVLAKTLALALQQYQTEKPAARPQAQVPTNCCDHLDVRLKELESRMDKIEGNVSELLNRQEAALKQIQQQLKNE